MQELPRELADKRQRVRTELARLGRVLVAFSGGVDSSLLLALAVLELGDRATAALAVSPSLAAGEREQALALARSLGAGVEEVETNEFEEPRYLANRGDRCFWCRASLVSALIPRAAAAGATLIYGAIADDLGDHRPGMRAAELGGMRAPLLEAGLTKSEVRRLARRMGLPVWDKPALACLSSRVPAGTPVTREALARVDAAERALRAFGLRIVRVRDHGPLGRVELGQRELAHCAEPKLRERVVAAVRAAGYREVTIDPDGYRPAGLLDKMLPRARS